MLKFKRQDNQRSPKIVRRASLNYYRSGPAKTKSPFQQNPRTKKRRVFSRVLDWLIIVIVMAGIIYSLVLRPNPEIEVNSTAYRSTKTYDEAVTKAASGFKNRNKLTFDKNGLLDKLKTQFPEVAAVRVDLPLVGSRPRVHIEIAEPALILKGAEGTFGASARLVVDSKGTVIGPSADFPSVKDLPLISDETGFETVVGRSVLSRSDIDFITTVIAQARAAKVPIASLALPKLAQELDLRTTDRKYFVKFYLGGDALTQSGQFLAARQKFDSTKKQPNQYLDVRISGKIFFR